jgi:hypothetical protein
LRSRGKLAQGARGELGSLGRKRDADKWKYGKLTFEGCGVWSRVSVGSAGRHTGYRCAMVTRGCALSMSAIIPAAGGAMDAGLLRQ